MFIVGVIAAPGAWLSQIPHSAGKKSSLIAIALMVALLALVATIPPDRAWRLAGGVYWQAAAFATWESLYCVAMVIAVPYWFKMRLNHQGWLTRILTQNAYAVFFVHGPIIVTLAWTLRSVDLDPLLKFVLVTPVGVAACFGFSHWVFRRLPGLRLLFT